MGGAMEDHIGPLLIENSCDSLLIADVSETWPDVSADPALAQLAVDLEERILSALDEDQPARAELHGLAADFRADAPACAGYKNRFTGQKTLQFGGIKANWLAAEQLEDIVFGVPRPSRPCETQTRPGWPWHTEGPPLINRAADR